MKNYYYRLVYIFSIIELFFISIFSIMMFRFFRVNTSDIIKIICGFVFLVFLFVILLKLYVKNNILEPMSRMLNSPDKNYIDDGIVEENDADVYRMLDYLRKNLKKANDEKKKTDTILEHMTDGVVAFDMDENVTYINLAAKRLLEIDEGKNSFDKIFSKFNDDDIDLQKIIYLNTWTSYDKKVFFNDKTMELLFVPFLDEIDRPVGLMVVIQDISEHERLNEMRKEFVADVSHELQTPLTSIKGFSENLLEDECDSETQKHFLKIINDNANRMENLIHDLLTLSKFDGKRENNKPEKFNLGQLTKECSEKFEIEIKKKNIDLKCFVTAEVPLVYANKDGVERVILNIISNAVKYTPDGGKIDIYIGFVHNDAYVKIKDTGIGIPKDDVEKVFERFYRVEKARSRKMGGTGLGLSIAKEIIEQNKGTIKINSDLGQGTEVIIKIPTISEEEV